MKGHENTSDRVTPQGHSERVLERLLSALEFMPDPALLVGNDGRIVMANDRATGLFGYRAGELTGLEIEALIPTGLQSEYRPHPPGYVSSPRQATMGPTVQRLSRRRDGSEFPAAVSLSAVAAPEGPLVIAAVRDMSIGTGPGGGLGRLLDAERDRIARGVHDLVIQRLFTYGLALEALRALGPTDPAEIDKRLHVVVEGLDSTIREIRSTVFALERPQRGFQAELMQLTRDTAPVLGFQPQVRFGGAVEAAVSDRLGGQALAVVREVLARIARHGEATQVSIDVSVGGGLLTLAVVDDDTVIDLTDRAAGLTDNMGGELDFVSLPHGGTRLDWRIPLAG